MAIANLLRKKVTPVITASAYADNDTLGIPKTGIVFSPNSPRTSYVDSVLLKLAHTAGIGMDIYVIKGVLATPPVDNALFAPTVAQLRAGLLAKISVVSGDWVQVGATDLFTLNKTLPPFIVRAGAVHTVVVQATDAITPGATNPLDIEFNVTELE